MKAGFTLLELLVVILILGFLVMMSVPLVNRVINDVRAEMYESVVEDIKSAAKTWSSDNTSLLPDEGDSITITLGDLKAGGYIKMKVIDPRTEFYLPNSLEIIISKELNEYIYEINENFISDKNTNYEL